MIPTQKTINLERKSTFTIPVQWRRQLNIKQGITVTLKVIRNHSIMIMPTSDQSLEVMSTVGRRGYIYIPTEIRNYFQRKGVNQFQVFIDDGRPAILLEPVM